MKIVVIYGSTTGNTENAAKEIAGELESMGEVSLFSIDNFELANTENYDVLLLGASTWGLGEIQDDWADSETLPGVDLSGKKVTFFGCGDQEGFSDTFVDAIGILAKAAEKAGATLVGAWPTKGYDFSNSLAVRDGFFAGLALDEDNQPELTAERIAQWTEQLKQELA